MIIIECRLSPASTSAKLKWAGAKVCAESSSIVNVLFVAVGSSLTEIAVTVKISVAELALFSPPSETVNVTEPDVTTPSSGVHVTTPILLTTIPAGSLVSK